MAQVIVLAIGPCGAIARNPKESQNEEGAGRYYFPSFDVRTISMRPNLETISSFKE